MLEDEEVLQRLRELLALSAKRAGLGIPDPKIKSYECHKAFLGYRNWLVESLLTG